VLGLLTIEWWLRRRSHRDTPAADRSAEEIDRVA
jgi:hypothetical protein